MFDLGDVVPLSVTIRDEDGNAANAGSVAVTITLPDGTTSTTSSITPTSTGQYDHDYQTVQAGRHGVRWVATGTNASVYEDAFDVTPTDSRAFVSLADVKAHMDKTGTSDDEELRGFVTAACQMIEERIGRVTPTTVVEDRTGCAVIVLEQRPVISVTSVASLPGLTAVDEAEPENSVAGWVLDGPAGILRHSGSSFGSVRITYRAGRTPVPGNVRLAALELTAHLWRSSQLNNSGGRPPFADSETPIMPGSAYALPIRVRELLGLSTLPTDQIFVG